MCGDSISGGRHPRPPEPAWTSATPVSGVRLKATYEEVTIAAPVPFAAVLFDMDGTLVDTEPLWHGAEVDTMADFGVQWTMADQEHALGGPMLRVANYMADRIGSSGQPRPEPQHMLELLLEYFETHLDAAPIDLDEGAAAILAEANAAALPLALVSNSPRRMMDKVLSAHSDLGFRFTLAGDEVVNSKPHPWPYLEAARVLGVAIEDCLIVEDSPAGIEAARNSGACVVALQHLARLDPGPRGIVVDSLRGLTLEGLSRQLR